ncbi:type II toxin-antitoxin system HipA family toxin [Treponema zioleckii]|uniref:type II toxin-antitoxin system HipA family toxin n=1 Tax=Treponema zioleckii TaxID=331680 RepID=UPI00168B55B6|nr:type II toxin-antitoxin system HipA family toxin [Treponema zioleckii]
MKLNVFFGNKKAGSLESTENRGVIFVYDENYLNDKNSVPLSASLPLQREEFPQKQCIPFFSGLLPEEDSRKKISDYLHISETSTLKLLEALGGECAGLISILNEEDSFSKETSYKLDSNNYELLDGNRLSEFIEKMNTRPLIKADDKLRLSLAGAQEKLALAKINGEWYLPLNGAPSTHILKPARTGSLSSLAQNEYICMKLAKSFGLPVPEVDLLKIAGKDIFVVERYDRIKEADLIQRLHQEDFCQALGIMSTSKYQNDGGPGIADIFNTILKVCTVPALESQKFLRYVLFNYVMGNCDSHGKNYSLVYKNNRVELSPLYDVVSTIIYSGLTEKLSMKIGKHYEIQKVTQEDFFLLAESLNIKYSVLSKIFDDFAKKYTTAFEELKDDEKISRDIVNSILQVVKSRF